MIQRLLLTFIGRRIIKTAMKRTLIDRIPMWLPDKIGQLCEGAKIYDSSCSPEARVYFIDGREQMFLKVAKSGSLKKEAQMTEYFSKKGLGARVLSYISGDSDIMLTTAVRGEDCTYAKYLDDPRRLAGLMGEQLRALHGIDAKDCPIPDVTSDYIARAEENYFADSYNKEHFPDSFGYKSGEEAYRTLTEGKDMLKNEVLIHGDYCLPNIMLDDWRFCGFIDLGDAGIGDRHVDLFWGRWTIGFNLRMIGASYDKAYEDRFFDAYGRDKIDENKLKTIAAISVLG